jgi:cyclic pyranopterin phosphate synthase
MTAHEHQHGEPSPELGVLTVSTSRSLAADPAGDAIVGGLDAAGLSVVDRRLVADDETAIRDALTGLIQASDAVVTTGGTGVTPDDVTIESVDFDKRLPGVGELFRDRSAEEIGTRAVATRATAGIVDATPVFCFPGSEAAARLAVEEIVVPEVGHLVGLATRSSMTEDSSQETPQTELTHTTDSGEAAMVDVGGKPESRRRAVATGEIRLQPVTVAAVRSDELEKGDVLGTTRVSAIQAVKHTWETIPLCHQIPITNVDVEIELSDQRLELTVAVETTGQTGCEMEALQGVSTGLATVFDMVKAIEKDNAGEYPETSIGGIRVREKTKTPTDP